MPLRFELGLHFGIVEELAVEDGDDGAVFVVDRLLAVREADDAEPAIGEPDAGLFEIAVLIGPAMDDGVGHARQGAGRNGAGAGEIDDACDAAHEGSTSRESGTLDFAPRPFDEPRLQTPIPAAVASRSVWRTMAVSHFGGLRSSSPGSQAASDPSLEARTSWLITSFVWARSFFLLLIGHSAMVRNFDPGDPLLCKDHDACRTHQSGLHISLRNSIVEISSARYRTPLCSREPIVRQRSASRQVTTSGSRWRMISSKQSIHE